MKKKEANKKNERNTRWRSERRRVEVWLTESDFFTLAQHADAAGQPLATYARSRVLAQPANETTGDAVRRFFEVARENPQHAERVRAWLKKYDAQQAKP